MSVSSFDHRYAYSPPQIWQVYPSSLAEGWRVRWSLLLALVANLALWAGIGFGLYKLIR